MVKNQIVLSFLFSILVSYPVQLFADDENRVYSFNRPNWVVKEGRCSASHITSEEAQRRAIEEARRSAIEEVTGVNIQALSLVKDYSLQSDLVETSSRGEVIKDTLLDLGVEQIRDGESLIVEYYAVVACSVAIVDRDIQSTLKVRIELDKSTYRDGEEINLEIYANEECYLTVLARIFHKRVRRSSVNSLYC
ncbi:MAG: hypothetical protein P9L92_11625 [Candidatus Electryonea clarkiae]|nr:hypothetical protein [Candidatus Electryonea clarkiae]MDP8286580.1 hypothetical protein [Candidatus Electryonea clarkiae]